MSLVHSNENLPSLVEGNKTQTCSICKKDYEIDDIIVSTPCDHVFHKDCIVNVLRETQACSICGKACRQTKLKSYNILSGSESQNLPNSLNTDNNTSRGAIPKVVNQSQSKVFNPRRNLNFNQQTPRVDNNPNGRISVDNLLNISQGNLGNQNAQFNDSNQNISDNTLQALINEAVRKQLASISLNSNTNFRQSFSNINPVNPNRDFQNEDNRSNQSRNFSNRNNSNRQNFSRQNLYQNFEYSTEKISNIMSGWHIKFSGQDEEGLSVDNFIYRVQSLTIQSLRGDFDVLCRHIHLLFSGKAMDWFWRFHRTAQRFDWDTLCTELRNQFRDRRTDFDLKEQIRRRKQRIGEKFDLFYDSILQITDRLQTPISDFELIEILKRNLNPEVRKELLHFDIVSISQLREFVRKHEILEEELDSRRSNRNFISRKLVSEIDDCVGENDQISIEDIHEIICWNCSEKGHRFEDCLGERRIFCYGCGAPNIFKPNCTKCNKYSKNYQAQPRPKQYQSKSTQM
ncbi:E3 ubiquitin-protein ligase RNF126-A [Lucilia cuprina]|nr:E3 ubiquitin-protein ligase RNF126-A [Lucilia cuprina]